MYQNIATKVLTGEVRLSYVHLTTPHASQPGEEPKYEVTILLHKSDIATFNDMRGSIEAAAQESIARLWNGFRPPNLEAIIKDGDGVKEKTGQPYGDECKGHWVISARSKQKPQVVHQSNIASELAPQDIYSGMYARVTINFFGYAHPQGGRGIGIGLGNVMKTRDGEPLAGGASAESDFSGVGNSAPAPAYTPATPVYAPPLPAYAPPAPTYTPPQTYGTTPGAINPLTGMPC